MTAALGRVEIGAVAPDFTLPSASGARVRLSAFRRRVVVLEWTNPVCPFTAKKYDKGAMQTLQRSAARRGAAWVSIDTAAPDRPGFLTPAAARERIAKTGAKVSAFLFDTEGRIGRLYGARTTPSFFIIGADGRLAYQGAADGDPWSTGPDSLAYPREALDDLFARRAVRRAESRPYGCPVEY